MKILLISGQLGVGKTERLNLILSQIAENRLTALCIVNDVGTTNVDALRVRSVGEVLPLTTGCICCESMRALRETFEAAFQRSDLDLVIVEPTGIADATTIRQAAERIGFDWRCLCLVDVKHFTPNQAIGMDRFQLPAATTIGLTWAEGIAGLDDDKLRPILEHIGTYSSAPIQILAQGEAPLLDDLLEEKAEVRKPHVCTSEHGHTHHHHHRVYASSVQFAEGVDEDMLVPVLVRLYQHHGLVRGKGVCKRTGDYVGLYEWDFVQGSIVWGAKSGGIPGGNFISTQEDLKPLLQFMCKQCDNNRAAVEQMAVFTDSDLPVEQTIEAIEYLLSQYPDPVTPDGRVLTNCDADPAKHLARRPGVPRGVHERAYRTSVAWRIEGFRHLVRQWETKVWPDDYSFYRACFILGKALINTLQIDWVNELMSAEIQAEINSLPTTALTMLGWEWMELHKPEEIAENLKVESVYRVLRYCMGHGLEQGKAREVFERAHQLFKKHRPDYNASDWHETL